MKFKRILLILICLGVLNTTPMIAFASEDDTIVEYEIGGVKMSVEEGQAFYSKLRECSGTEEIKALCEEYGISYDSFIGGTETSENGESETPSTEEQNATVESNPVTEDKLEEEVEEIEAVSDDTTDEQEEKEPEESKESKVKRKTVNYDYKNKGLIIGMFIGGCVIVLGGIALLFKRLSKRK